MLKSGWTYGYRKIHLDLQGIRQRCEGNKFYRLMNRAKIRIQFGNRITGMQR
uniref:hypothetical protein n=1 Tax=Enterobacter bugandensis TaxID=881260 RepID=UPI0035DED6E9